MSPARLYGVTVRWSLHATPGVVTRQLRAYVQDVVAAPPEPEPDLHQRLWTLREGGSFGATSVWTTDTARAAFVEQLRTAGSVLHDILGTRPDAIEEFEVLGLVGAAPAPAQPDIPAQSPPTRSPSER